MSKRLEHLLAELTLEEKASLMSGKGAWDVLPVERLGIPSLKVTDGPAGARGAGLLGSGTPALCIPCGSALGATWNPQLITELGKSLARETHARGSHVLLAPTVNIHRTPLGGRNFECYSEDPYLTGEVTVAYVQGVQSEKVSACLKHFVGNDTEYQRHTVSSNIKPRALREIYLLPFEMGVKQGGALSVMSAYNQLNNIYCSSHEELLINILKEEWNFPGYVVSDWGAALQTIENANGGLDCEMPGPAKTWGENLVKAIKDNKVKEALVDDKVKRILRIAEFTGRLDNPEEKQEESNDLEKDRKLIKKAATEAMVLLKNDNVLPFNKSEIKSLAVIGPNAEKGQFIGGGSATVKPHYVVHPLEGLTENLKEDVEVKYAKGCHTHKYLPAIEKKLISCPKTQESGFLVDFYKGEDFGGEILESSVMKGGKFWALSGFGIDIASKMETPSLSARFTTTLSPKISGEHIFELISIGPARLKINGKEIVDNWTSQEPGDAFFSYGSAPKRSHICLEQEKDYLLEIEYKWQGRFPAIQIGMLPPDEEDLMERAVSLAKECDAVVMVVGTNSDWETEGNDRSELGLPGDQDILIDKVVKANSNSVVVINTGSPITMPWNKDAKAILQSWFPGQEFGNALCDILFGKTNPSGKLPTTIPMKLEDTPAFNHYPGENLQMDYLEEIYVGYRWYDKEKIKPLFPFGFGLTYTHFHYSNLRIIPPKKEDSAIAFSFTVSNVGQLKGKEVVQCYVSVQNSSIERAPKELKKFSKVDLDSGESKELIFELNERDLSYWNEDKKSWSVEPAEYKILVGGSSEETPLEASAWLG